MKPIAIACGDPSGIGPEVAVKAVSLELEARGGEGADTFVWIGDRKQLEALSWPLSVRRPEIIDPRPEPLPSGLRPASPVAAAAALDYLRHGALGCLSGDFAALVTAPVCKESIHRLGIPFTGQTEYLAQMAGTDEVTMMLLGDDDAGRWLRVALATTHVPLRRVPETLTSVAVLRAIRHASWACHQLGLTRARVAVCGLNPHAGEGGLLGDEEERILGPALNEARRTGLDVTGPLSADTVFYAARRGDYEAVVAMYHDQGLAPLKTVAFDSGVNWTLGLPFIRTSPDHGTAFDLAGKGVARTTSMQAAVKLARQLSRTRNAIVDVTAATN